MRPSKTVFIIGAGASSEVGIPSGRKFLDIVSEKLNFQFHRPSLASGLGDHGILDVIQNKYAHDLQTLKSYVAAAQRIREGVIFSRSIDSFIDAHRDDQKIQLLGKLAIAKTILEQEQQSALHRGLPEVRFQDIPKLNQSWFVVLARGLNDGVWRNEIDRVFERVSFIVFNYDRCVEHFLYNAIQEHFGVDQPTAKSVMQHLTILHPYGMIAKLRWQGDCGIPFGFPANRQNLMMMADQIKTYTEQIEDNDTLSAIKREVEDTEALVFLGFSYQDLNIKLLDPGKECTVRSVYGTAYEISDSNVEEIKEQLRRLVGHSLAESRMRGSQETISERLYIRSHLKCAELLEEYSRSLFVTGRRSQS
jgi:hypothetical protein